MLNIESMRRFNKYVFKIFYVFSIFFFYSFAYSQNFTSLTETHNDSIRESYSKGKKSPTLAMLLSTALPGAGQFYNQSYWKIPIIVGLAAYWGYEWKNLNKEYKNYKNLYSNSLTLYPPYGIIQYKNIRDFYKSERDKFAWYLGVLYVANIIDAYVDANLFDFDVSENLSAKNSENGFYLKIKFYF